MGTKTYVIYDNNMDDGTWGFITGRRTRRAIGNQAARLYRNTQRGAAYAVNAFMEEYQPRDPNRGRLNPDDDVEAQMIMQRRHQTGGISIRNTGAVYEQNYNAPPPRVYHVTHPGGEHSIGTRGKDL